MENHFMNKYSMTRQQFFDHLLGCEVVSADNGVFYSIVTTNDRNSLILKRVDNPILVPLVFAEGYENFTIEKVFDRSVDILIEKKTRMNIMFLVPKVIVT